MKRVVFPFFALTVVIICVLIGLISFYEGEQVAMKRSQAPKNTMIPNPATTYCNKLGGIQTVKTTPEGQVGFCTLGNKSCEEWALYRGTCKLTDATNAAIANPASVNCAKLGGTLSIEKDGTGAEYGLCQLGSGYACEEWALLRGDCPKTGVKTTGYDNIEEKYCAWLGGKTLAVTNATCTFDDGSVCNDIALYNGQCHKGKY